MKIKGLKSNVGLGDVPNGKVVKIKNKLFIVVSLSGCTEVALVNLETGLFQYFDRDISFEQVNCDLIINQY